MSQVTALNILQKTNYTKHKTNYMYFLRNKTGSDMLGVTPDGRQGYRGRGQEDEVVVNKGRIGWETSRSGQAGNLIKGPRDGAPLSLLHLIASPRN